MKPRDSDFYADYVSTSEEFKHFEFMQWFLNIIVDDVYCDIIDNIKGELELIAEFALSNYENYKEHRPSKIRFDYMDKGATPRKPTIQMIAHIMSKYNYQCTSCGSLDNLEIDHIFPYSKGGKTVLNNLTVLCGSCNRKKSTKLKVKCPSQII